MKSKKQETEAAPEKTAQGDAVVIAHAYALVPEAGKVGRFRAVHLTNVLAESIECLEPSNRSEPAGMGLARCESAMAKRHRKGEW
jgi:hypothetical protein